jgi:hypothetical protein
VVYRFDRESLRGYVNPATWITEGGVELLSPEGALVTLPLFDLKVVSFVKDFDGGSLLQEKRLFASRPKTAGIWVRAQLRNNEVLEGVMSNDLLLIERFGFWLIPPDPSSNNQRLFLPRAALKEFRVVGVIGSKRRGKAETERQIKLFE